MTSKVIINENEEKTLSTKIWIKKNVIHKKIQLIGSDDVVMYTFLKKNIGEQDYKESNNNGNIYFLINEKENKIYVGKSKNIGYRMFRHSSTKDFDKVIILNSQKWTDTILSYLEYWFIDFFKNKQNDYEIINLKNENEPITLDHDKVYIKLALEASKILLLNENINIGKTSINKENKIIKNEVSENISDKCIEVFFKDIKSNYNIKDNKVILYKGITFKWSFEKYKNNDYDRRDELVCGLIKRNTISEYQKDVYVFNIDYYCSPSLACCLILNLQSYNGKGKDGWKDKDGRSINEILGK